MISWERFSAIRLYSILEYSCIQRKFCIPAKWKTWLTASLVYLVHSVQPAPAVPLEGSQRWWSSGVRPSLRGKAPGLVPLQKLSCASTRIREPDRTVGITLSEALPSRPPKAHISFQQLWGPVGSVWILSQYFHFPFFSHVIILFSVCPHMDVN